MKFCTLTLALLSCAGCVNDIPDAWDVEPSDPPCDRVIIVQPDNIGVCMTEAEFRRWVRRNLPTS